MRPETIGMAMLFAGFTAPLYIVFFFQLPAAPFVSGAFTYLMVGGGFRVMRIRERYLSRRRREHDREQEYRDLVNRFGKEWADDHRRQYLVPRYQIEDGLVR